MPNTPALHGVFRGCQTSSSLDSSSSPSCSSSSSGAIPITIPVALSQKPAYFCDPVATSVRKVGPDARVRETWSGSGPVQKVNAKEIERRWPHTHVHAEAVLHLAAKLGPDARVRETWSESGPAQKVNANNNDAGPTPRSTRKKPFSRGKSLRIFDRRKIFLSESKKRGRKFCLLRVAALQRPRGTQKV